LLNKEHTPHKSLLCAHAIHVYMFLLCETTHKDNNKLFAIYFSSIIYASVIYIIYHMSYNI